MGVSKKHSCTDLRIVVAISRLREHSFEPATAQVLVAEHSTDPELHFLLLHRIAYRV
jgi:hypothetical protein